VLAAGRAVATPRLREASRAADLVVAADGGLRHASTLGVEPDLLVGDFDSLDRAVERRWPGVPRVTHPVDKDALDLELALDEALARGARETLIVGALGDRLDQSLSAVAIAERYHLDRLAVTLDSGDALVLPLRPGETRSVPLPEGTTVSVLATHPGTSVSLTGAQWTLRRHLLEPGVGLGVSNRARGEGPSLSLHGGGAVLVVPQLPAPAIATIWGEQAPHIREDLQRRDPALADAIERLLAAASPEPAALELRARALLALAHLALAGHAGALPAHALGALRAGATPGEVREVLFHAAALAGSPSALASAGVADALGDDPVDPPEARR
jgi:thiamine pyrophosphokinase